MSPLGKGIHNNEELPTESVQGLPIYLSINTHQIKTKPCLSFPSLEILKIEKNL